MAIVLVVSLGVTSVIPEVKPPNLSLHQSRLPGSRDDGSRRVRNDGTRRVPLLALTEHVHKLNDQKEPSASKPKDPTPGELRARPSEEKLV